MSTVNSLGGTARLGSRYSNVQGLAWNGCLALLVIGLLALVPARAWGQSSDRYHEARQQLVDTQLAREGITNTATLNAMRTVPRHLFVAPEYRSHAYFDQALPIGHKQTISPPFIVAYMTQSLDPQPTDRVLEIGTGSGYQAAVLSQIVQEVYTIEIVEPLGKNAAKALREVGYKNVFAKVGDGYRGWPEKAPFDKIIVTCSPENVPQPLVDQLREGGKMIIPLGERYAQVFYLLEKKDGMLVRTRLLPALFVPMTGVSEEQRKVKPDPAHPELRNGSFELKNESDGLAESWYYQRQLKLVSGGAPDGQNFVLFENHDEDRGAQLLQGMAVDGTQVSALNFSLQARGQSLKVGVRPFEKPALIVHFFDGDRRPVGEEQIGPWNGSFPWKKFTETIHVPPRAREAIIRVGLNGGTGLLSVDDIRMTVVPR